MAVGYFGVRGLRRAALPAPAAWRELAAALGVRMGLRAAPVIAICRRGCEAGVVGLLRPMILVPASWLLQISPAVLESILAHELAHVRRHDLWIILAQRLVETFLFYHPAVWWISRRMHVEREMCCDELAVTATGDRVSYARALEALAGRRMDSAQPAAVLAYAHGGGEMVLLDRVRRILGVAPARPTVRAAMAGPLVAVVPLVLWLALALALALAVGAPPELAVRAEPTAPAKSAAPAADGSPTELGAPTDLGAPGERKKAVPKALPKGKTPPAAGNAAEKCFVIETKLLRDDGSTAMVPRVSAQDGQTVLVSDRSQSPFVTRLTRAPGGALQPNIEILDEGVSIKLKAVADIDGLINVDATVEVSGIASVAMKTVAQTSRQSPRQKSYIVRAIESVAPGEKLTIPIEDPRPSTPAPTTLQALTNVVRGERPSSEEQRRTTALEITVLETKTPPRDMDGSWQPHPPGPGPTAPAPRVAARTAALPDSRVAPVVNRSDAYQIGSGVPNPPALRALPDRPKGP